MFDHHSKIESWRFYYLLPSLLQVAFKKDESKTHHTGFINTMYWLYWSLCLIRHSVNIDMLGIKASIKIKMYVKL